MSDARKQLVADTNTLAKMCGLFSSEHAGERASAASMADRFLRDRGLRWPDVIRLATAKRAAPRSGDAFALWGGWRMAAAKCLRSDALTAWERLFCRMMVDHPRHDPGPSNRSILRRIVCRLL